MPLSTEIEVRADNALGEEVALDWPSDSIAVRTLRGRLIPSEQLADAGSPLQDVSLKLLDLRTARFIEAGHTNDDGSYGFSTVEPGLYVVRVTLPAKGKVESGWHDLAVELDPAANDVAIPEMKVLQSECAGVHLFRKIGAGWEHP